MTKQEKELVKQIEVIMVRKRIEGNPSEYYTIEKKSTNNYEGKVTIGNLEVETKGKDTKTTAKNLTKELK